VFDGLWAVVVSIGVGVDLSESSEDGGRGVTRGNVGLFWGWVGALVVLVMENDS